MRHFLQTLFVYLLMLVSSPSGNAQPVFEDSFTGYAPGLPPPHPWRVVRGFWTVHPGFVCESSRSYDSALLYDTYIDFSFELTVRVRWSESAGAGLFFSAEAANATSNAHMVRLDGDQVLLGFFQNGFFEAVQVEPLPGLAADSVWHRLRLLVDLGRDAWRFEVDGRPVGTWQTLRFAAGFVGLQNSASPACFDEIRLQPLQDNRRASAFQWATDLAVTDRGLLVCLPGRSTVVRVGTSGHVEKSYTLGGDGSRTRQFSPVAVAAFADGRVAVIDSAHRRIQIFDESGSGLAAVGPPLHRPVALCVTGDGGLLVADAESHRLVKFDSTFSQVSRMVLDSLQTVAAMAFDDGRLAVLDTTLNRVFIYDVDGLDARWLADFEAPAGGWVEDLDLASSRLYLVTATSLEKRDLGGNLLGRLNFDWLVGSAVHGVAVRGSDLFLSDYARGTVVRIDTALSLSTVSWQWKSRYTARLRRHGAGRKKLMVTYRPLLPAGAWSKVFFPEGVDEVAVPLPRLAPATPIEYRVEPFAQAWPEERSEWQRAFAVSPSPADSTPYREIDAAVLLFTAVADTSDPHSAARGPQPLPQAEIQRIRDQLEDGRRFFWMNSGMRLHLRLHTFVIDTPFWRHTLFGPESYYPPRDSLVEKILQQHGADVANFQAVFYIACIPALDPETGRWELRGRGGAFTQGIGANGRYGISWWEATRAYHPSGNNWLLVHEFHHQLDELFARSGFPEYWFNHFAPLAGTAAKFGEHFDGNAFLLRQWPIPLWHALRFGTLRFARDQDGDGLPDDDARLPMDERRLHSRGDRRDTDGDGLNDDHELRLANWVVEGQGQFYAQPQRLPRLDRADSDGDGLVDGRDPQPLYPWFPKAPLLDEEPAGNIIGRSTDPRAPYDLRVAWRPDSLVLRMNLPQKRRIRLLIDANADGWFVGKDNIEFRLWNTHPDSARVMVLNAAQRHRWPFQDNRLAEKVRFQWRRVAGEMWELSIARIPLLGLLCRRGERLGVNIAVSATMDDAGHEAQICIYEPNRFFDFVLD